MKIKVGRAGITWKGVLKRKLILIKQWLYHVTPCVIHLICSINQFTQQFVVKDFHTSRKREYRFIKQRSDGSACKNNFKK